MLECADLCPGTKDVALEFDGINDFAGYNDSNPSLGDSKFAVEAWVNPLNEAKEMGIIFGQDGAASASHGMLLKYQKITLVLNEPITSTYVEYLYRIVDVTLN